MKKFFLGMFAAAAALFATSCSSEDFATEQGGNEITASFSVSTPKSINSRAIADGNTVDKVVCAVYDADGKEISELRQYIDMEAGKANFSTRLVKGQAYRIAFFAYNEDADAYDVTDLKNIVVKGEQLSNKEDRDAFTAKIDITANESTSAISKTVMLYRPFAQLNIGCPASDWAAAVTADITVAKTYVKVTDVYSAFNAYADEVVEDSLKPELVFALSDILPVEGEKLVVNEESYTYLAMNYLLVDSTKSLTNVEFLWEAENGKKNDPITTFGNIPVQRNYRTNILGHILTNPANIQIVVDAQFDGEHPYYTGIIPLGNNTYAVNSPEGMTEIANLIAEVNPTEAKIITIEMQEDIDMTGYAWTPMRAHFVNFDGKGHTISNLNCGVDATGKSGFCGYLGASTIKNLTLNNVTVAGEQAGIIAGLAEAGTLENVSITGQNSVSYLNTAYDESWGGIGVIFGVNTGGERAVGVTIQDGASVSISKVGMTTTESGAGNKYAMHQAVTVTDNGNFKETLAEGLVYDAASDTYEVSTAEGLVYANDNLFAASVNNRARTTSGNTYKLFADIDMNGQVWTSKIGSNSFTFDGNGHKISNWSTSSTALLAPYTNASFTVKNLTLENCSVNSSVDKFNGSTGLIAGTTDANGLVTIENCRVIGNTTVNTNGNDVYAGALIGYSSATQLNILNCSVEGATIGGTTPNSVGGFVGHLTAKNAVIENATVSACTIKGERIDKSGIIAGTIQQVATITVANIAGNTVYDVADSEALYGRIVGGCVYTTEGGEEVATVQGDYMNNAFAKGVSTVYLLAGNYALNNNSNLKNAASTSIIGKDKENVKVTITGNIRATDGVTSLTLKNLTTNVPTGLAYGEHDFGWIHYLKEFKMIDCKSNGRIRLNVHSAVIENCEFEVNTTSGFDGYAIYYGGATNSNVKVINSTFNTAGKAIVLYNEHGGVLNLDVEGCTFTSSDAATDKAAIQMHTELGITGTVDIKNSTASGFLNINNGLWNELNNGTKEPTDVFDITVNGVQVH